MLYVWTESGIVHHALLALTPSPPGLPRCWGWNRWGQLGRENGDDMGDAPGEVASLADVDFGAGRTVVQLSAGGFHSCVLLDDAQLCAPRPSSRPMDGLRQRVTCVGGHAGLWRFGVVRGKGLVPPVTPCVAPPS